MSGGVWSATLFEDVRHDRVEQHGIDPDERQIRRHVDRDGPLAEVVTQPRHGPLDELGRIVDLEIRLERAGFDPAQVEDRADQPVEALGLG